MKRVGILTHYYNSMNYGGNLQAYALAKYISSLKEYSAEQISFRFLDTEVLNTSKLSQKNKLSIKIKNNILHPVIMAKKFTKCIIHFLCTYSLKSRINRCINLIYKRDYKERCKNIAYFNKVIIPNSSCVYTYDNIVKANEKYDIFVVGSDQVWSGCNEVFALTFVDAEKGKISYAASVARKEIANSHKDFLRERLKTFDYVSVRDSTDKMVISSLIDQNVEVVVDPVFLISDEEWMNIIPEKEICNEAYVFSYFLGDSKKIKKIVKQFAKEKGLKLVVIPNFRDNENDFVKNDIFYGDIKPYNVSPADFVKLIKNAEYIFTDSFHAVVFSLIFKKEFFAFDRLSKWGNMSSRLINILSEVGCLDRFVTDNILKKILANDNKINYDCVSNVLAKNINYSKDYLNKALKYYKLEM